MLTRRSAPQGFTLIELMVAVAVLGVLTALAFPSYKAWIQNTRIKTTAASILNGLQIARSEAVRRNAQVQFVLGANSDWTVGCFPGVPPVPLTAACPDATIQSRSTSEGSTSNITVALADALGNATPGNTTVVFTSLGGLAPAPAPVPFAQANVTVSTAVLAAADAKPLRVTLGAGGNARMCDPNPSIPTSDARHC